MVETKVRLCGVDLDNPIIPASGTFGFGYEFAQIYDINCLGSLSFKGTTLEPRFGNATPRIAETPSGMLTLSVCKTPGLKRLSPKNYPSSELVSTSQSWQTSVVSP